jgi:cathepsin A (carboxypeptidase C)
MRTLLALLSVLPLLVVALPQGMQRPMLLDEVKSGKLDSNMTHDCYTSTINNQIVCVSSIVVPNPGQNNIDWGTTKSTQYCGHMEYSLGGVDAKYYFWLVMSEKNPSTDPLVLWLNGGPGASSLLGLFTQWGPRLLQREAPKDKTPRVLKSNPNRVTENMSWVFLEQPVGVGFSSSNVKTSFSDDAAADVMLFLHGFMNHDFVHKEKAIKFNDNPFHIAGESFAGHYVAAIGDAIVRGPWKPRNFQSLIIGNGLLDYKLAPAAFRDLFCPRTGHTPLLEVPKKNNLDAMCLMIDKYKDKCINAIVTCQNARQCDPVGNACFNVMTKWNKDMDRDLYDFSKSLDDQEYRESYHLDGLVKFINSQLEGKTIGVEPKYSPDGKTLENAWRYLDNSVKDRFRDSGDYCKSYLGVLQNVLNNGIKVLLYAVSLPLLFISHDR